MFSGLASEERIRVLLELIGGPAYKAQLAGASKFTTELSEATKIANKQAIAAARGTFLYGQAIYTLRRYAFYGTLALTGLAAWVVKLGFSYNATRQQAIAMLAPFVGGAANVKRVTDQIFRIAALTPFQFKDVSLAFQQMFVALKGQGVSTGTVLKTIQAISNGLSAIGRTSPEALNKAALALQKMAYQGRLTGLTIRQLASDGIPIYDILNKKLGITGNQLSNIASLNLPANTVLKAINSYLLNTKGFSGAAIRSQLQTFQGVWSTFKDFLSQAAGGSTGGAFSGIFKMLRGIDLAFAGINSHGGVITMRQFVTAIDSVVSPKTHAVLIFFNTLTGVFNGFVFAANSVIKIISGITTGLSKLLGIFGIKGGSGGVTGGAHVLGFTVGLFAAYTLIHSMKKAVLELATAFRSEAAAETASSIFSIRGSGRTLVTFGKNMWIAVAALRAGKDAMAAEFIFGAKLTKMFTWLTTGVTALTTRLLAFDIVAGATVVTMLTWLGVLGAIAAAIYLIIKYHKQLGAGVKQVFNTKPLPQQSTKNQPFFSWDKGFKYGIPIQALTPWKWKAKDILGNGPSWGFNIKKIEPWHWFGTGGIVPGPIGSPKMIMAHGGETVLPNPNYNIGTSKVPGNIFSGTQFMQPIILQVGQKTLLNIIAQTRADVAAGQ
jgi:tape measure domain-containing protein